MAAVLEKLLTKEITPADVVRWMLRHKSEIALTDELDSLSSSHAEFLPFFLNFLRDQSLHLIQGCRSANNTPAKTPTSSKLKRLTAILDKVNSSNISNKSSSPTDNSAVSKQNTTTESTFNVSQYSDNSINSKPGSSSAPRKHRNSLRHESGGKSHRSIQFSTPEVQKPSKKTSSLGDFLSPNNDTRNRKSPLCGSRRNDSESSPHSGRRSGGKGKGQGGDKKPGRHSQWIPKEEKPPAVFNLKNIDDFPPVLSKVSTKTTDIPEGATLITPSRRVVLMPATSPSEQQLNPSIFTNSPVLPAGAASSSHFSNVWDRPLATSKSKSSMSSSPTGDMSPVVSKPSRRILPNTLLSPPVSSSSSFTAASENSPLLGPHCSTPQRLSITSPGMVSSTPDNTNTRHKTFNIDTEKQPILEHITPVKPKLESELRTILELTAITPTKSSILERLASVDVVTPDKEEVTHRHELDDLANLYSQLVAEHIVPNVAIELYFIIQLLTARGSGEVDSMTDLSQELDEVQYLSTVHNAVYFAVKVLSNAFSLLLLLDRSTLRLLADNQRLTEFSPQLKANINAAVENMSTKSQHFGIPSPIGGVSFQADTDNVKNFPSERSFHLFKKQRDQFYELLREWDEGHLVPGWSVEDAIGDRIRSLVVFRSELANHIHFARLFLSQLIQMCKGDSTNLSEDNSEHISLLTELKLSNPDKFKKLRERLITPSTYGGPCPPPTFPGCQEFFHEFIAAASCHMFNQHLMDAMANKIYELDSMPLMTTDGGVQTKEEVVVDAEDKETLVNNLVTLHLLGKFLGYVSFLPYQTTERLPETMLATSLQVRDRTQPAVDVMGLLRVCVREGRCVLMVPWLTQYLAMMDSLAPQTQYYNQLLQLLLSLYSLMAHQYSEHHQHSQLLVLLVLGWFFQLPVFPDSLFFCNRNSDNHIDLSSSPSALDNLNIVDQFTVYLCCPYLGEIRNLLVDFAVGASNQHNSIRKITPMSAVPNSPVQLNKKQLQHQLEENFFHNHPSSLRRIVEFVADRVASNHIKIYRKNSFPEILLRAQNKAQILAKEFFHDQHSDNGQQKRTYRALEQASTELCRQARQEGAGQAPSYCEARVSAILPELLAEETPSEVVDVAKQIAYRSSVERVYTWLNTQLTPNLLKKEMTGDLERHIKSLTAEDAATQVKQYTAETDTSTHGIIQKLDTSHNASAQILLTPSDNEKKMTNILQTPITLRGEIVSGNTSILQDSNNLFTPGNEDQQELSEKENQDPIPKMVTTMGQLSLKDLQLLQGMDDFKISVGDGIESQTGDKVSLTHVDSVLPEKQICECSGEPGIEPLDAGTDDGYSVGDQSEKVAKSETSVTDLPVVWEVYSPSECLINIKSVVQTVIMDAAKFDPRQVTCVLDGIKEANRRHKLDDPSFKKMVAKLTTELAVSIVLHMPHQWTPVIQRPLFNLWLVEMRNVVGFQYIICPKHLYLWNNLQTLQSAFPNLVHQLLRKDLLSTDVLHTSITKLISIPSLSKELHAACGRVYSMVSSLGITGMPSESMMSTLASALPQQTPQTKN